MNVKTGEEENEVVCENDQLASDTNIEDLDSHNNEVSKKAKTNEGIETFTFNELVVATKNFKSDCFLGEGGFGKVYRGYLGRINNQVKISPS